MSWRGKLRVLHDSACTRFASLSENRAVSGMRLFANDTSVPDQATDSQQASPHAGRAQSDAEASTTEAQPPARKKGKRLSRKERGSWVNNPNLTDELRKSAPVWPASEPMYDVQGQAPWLLDIRNPILETYQRLKAERPAEFAALMSEPHEDPPPRDGARKILEWEINVVFDSDPVSGEVHPLNKKVKCRVYLRDLQREFDLSEKAVKYIAILSGPRYNPNKGLLTLTSEKYAHREDNRRHVVETLHRLVEEGIRCYPHAESAAAGQA